MTPAVRCIVALFLQCLLAASSHALDAGAVEALQQAVSESLAAQSASASGPEEFRKGAFFPMPKSVLAVVFVKPNADDCAARTATRKSPCRVQMWRQDGVKSWSLQYSFEFVYQPIGVTLANGNAVALWVSISDKNVPDYRKLMVDGREISLNPELVLADELQSGAHLQFDDRNTPPIADTLRVLRQGSAKLAPARILYDEINSFLDPFDYQADEFKRLTGIKDAVVSTLMPALDRDLQTIASRTAWYQWVDVRARICSDWLVPREFWKAERRRLPTLNLCLDPIVNMVAKGITQANASNALALARYYLINEVGTAYLFRKYPEPIAFKQELIQSGNTRAITVLGAAAGTLLAAKAGLQSPQERIAASTMHAKFLEVWFDHWEKRRGYTAPTPELRRSYQIAQFQLEGIQCAAAVSAKPAVSTAARCPADIEPHVKAIARSIAGD